MHPSSGRVASQQPTMFTTKLLQVHSPGCLSSKSAGRTRPMPDQVNRGDLLS
jgi:hypothetical protein